MITAKLKGWIRHKWQPAQPPDRLSEAVGMTFSNEAGHAVLNYLLDNYYCTVIATGDPLKLAEHNGQRSVVHDLLQKLDEWQQPNKYEVTQIAEVVSDARQ